MRTWKNQSKIVLSQHENESIRCSSSSDSNFQLQRRHSDSICSSWDDGQQILTTSSSGRGSSNSAHRYKQKITNISSKKNCSFHFWCNKCYVCKFQICFISQFFFFFAIFNYLISFISSDNSISNDVIIPIEVETLLNTSNRDATHVSTTSVSIEVSESSTSIESVSVVIPPNNGHIENNLAMQQPSLITVDNAKDVTNDEKDIMLEWHRNKPSIWQQYYGSKRLKYSNMVKKIKGKFDVNTPVMSYVSI